jgi:adenosine/AMP kinase
MWCVKIGCAQSIEQFDVALRAKHAARREAVGSVAVATSGNDDDNDDDDDDIRSSTTIAAHHSFTLTLRDGREWLRALVCAVCLTRRVT